MSSGAACTGTGSAPSYAHQAGDRFIFKGGDKWPGACLPLSIAASGTGTAQDYYGVDKNWYTGGSWTRPLFDANYATVNNMIYANGITYVTIDNIELAHQGITPNTSFSTASCGIYFGNLAWGGWQAGTTVENVYIHDWAVTSNLNANGATNFDNICVGGILSAALVNNVEISGANSYVYINGTKTLNPFGGGVAGVGELKNSKIHDGWNGCTTSGSCHDSEFYNIQGGAVENYTGVHSQVIEDNEPCPTTVGHSMAVYNNLVHDNTNVGVVFYLRYFSQVYNNVFWNNSQNAIQYCVPDTDSSSHVGYAFNNTFDEGGMTAMIPRSGAPKALGTFYSENNIVINGTLGGLPATAGNVSNNWLMSTSEATTYGFTSANLYAPTSSDPNTATTGANLTGVASGSLTPLVYDTEGAPWFGGTAKSRPTGSTAWTLGAYEFGGQSASKPNPPTGLVAIVQ